MKIGFFIQGVNKNNPKGGAERVLIELANELIVRKHDVTIFCIDTKNRDEFMYPVLPEVKNCNLLEPSNNLIDRIKFEFFINVATYRNKIYKKVNQLIQIPSSLFKNSDPSKSLSSEKTPSKLKQYLSEYSWKLNHIAHKYIFKLSESIKIINPTFLYSLCHQIYLSTYPICLPIEIFPLYSAFIAF